MKRLGLSMLLLAIVVVWGWTFVVVKEAVADYGVVPFLAVRFAIGAGCVALFTAGRAEWRSFRTGAAIGLVLAAAYLLQTLGLDSSTATNTGLITGLFIVFAPLANRVLFGVPTSGLLWAAIAVSLGGLALLAGFGLHVALLDRYSKGHRAATLAAGQLTAAAVVFAGLWGLRGPLIWPPTSVWPALLLTGGIATAAAFFVQTFVQQRLSAVETGMIILTEPIFAAVFGQWLMGDRLTGWQVLGAVLMVAAVFAAELVPLVRNRRGRTHGERTGDREPGCREPGTLAS